jgi:hypothetical protein
MNRASAPVIRFDKPEDFRSLFGRAEWARNQRGLCSLLKNTVLYRGIALAMP